jgi:hypothetical protein
LQRLPVGVRVENGRYTKLADLLQIEMSEIEGHLCSLFRSQPFIGDELQLSFQPVIERSVSGLVPAELFFCREDFETVCFDSFISKQALKWAWSACLRAF